MAINAGGYPQFAHTATCKVSATALAAVAATALDAQVTGTQFDGIVKNLTITPGSRDVELINTLGYGSSVVSDVNRGGQIIGFKKPEFTVAKFTLVSPVSFGASLTSDSIYELAHGTNVRQGATDYYRTDAGVKSSGDRVAKAIAFSNQTNSSRIHTTVMNNAWFTDIETTLEPDGSEEITITAKCLAADTYNEHTYA